MKELEKVLKDIKEEHEKLILTIEEKKKYADSLYLIILKLEKIKNGK